MTIRCKSTGERGKNLKMPKERRNRDGKGRKKLFSLLILMGHPLVNK
jgi:hypothetical protein